MLPSLTIIGGCYFEDCIDPEMHELWGSGLRAAAALSNKDFQIELISCIGNTELETAKSICDTFGISSSFVKVENTITFEYYHPLSSPEAIGIINGNEVLPEKIVKENILYYGMIEAKASVHGNFVVYDPQNYKGFKETGSTATHLALILNKKEAYLLSGLKEDTSLEDVGYALISSQAAEVVVIKRGSQGALVFEKNSVTEIPVYKTQHVWPIGSGDIFTAVFAWKWIISTLSGSEAALIASQFTATYCQSRNLPLTFIDNNIEPSIKRSGPKKIYLAGPFFTVADRWLINETRNLLIDFGNKVFSPFHEIGLVDTNNLKQHSNYIADKDLSGLKECNTILAMVSSSDSGTCLEVGYACALNKEIIIFNEKLSESDLVMFYGTNCKIVSDLSSAIYMASW